MLFDPLTPKKLQLLHELIPGATSVGFLINPRNPNATSHRQYAEAATRSMGLRVTMLSAGNPAELDSALSAARRQGIEMILVGDDPFFDVSSRQLTRGAAGHGIPTMYYVRDFTAAGGLMSYGPTFSEMAQQAGEYASQILKGADPAELPIRQPTKFELVINLKAAKALGLAVPPSIINRADEVIE